MASVRDGIENSFEELGVVYDQSILDKCVELCLDHGLEDADELVDSWMAYSVSHLQGENPTSQHLSKFEREVLAKRAKQKKTESEIELVTDFSTPSAKYTGRKNAGSIICEKKLTSIESTLDSAVSVKQAFPDATESFRYMSYHLSDCADVVERQINTLTSQLAKRFALDDILPVRTKHPTSVVIAGRVVCDADGKLNAESLLLESSPESGGEVVRLDLSNLPSYSVFPGQVIAVEGLNVSGQKMVASRIWSDCSSDSTPPPLELPGAIKIIVACGPFTTSDALAYQPLLDLMEVVVKEEPHLLLLTGPLIDSDHPAISGGLISETFNEMLERLIEQIIAPITGMRTQVVLVASHREALCAPVFPTPALQISHPKLTVVPDPCILDIEGIQIAAISIDVLMHLGKEEVSYPPHSGDRLSRLASHVFQQQHFYPLKPPMLGLPLDVTLEENLKLSSTPHILILPSDLRCFIKEIQNCHVINPERLAKGLVGGSFAKLTVGMTGTVQGEIIKI